LANVGSGEKTIEILAFGLVIDNLRIKGIMLTIKHLKKSYKNRSVIRDLNLQVNLGEIYGLLGANGAGKTTIINIICHLLKADSGLVEINGQLVSEKTKQWIGIAPQENLFYKSLTCAENLNFYAKIYGLSSWQRRRQVTDSLKAVNLLERANSLVSTLSGGMQRRMNIAIAIVHQPKLLILDEPTTGLDIEARYEIWHLIQSLKERGMTILLTTHLLDEAQRLCHRIGILKDGQMVAEGTLDELRRLVPAKEIAIVQTPEEKLIIMRAKELGFGCRHYGNDLALLLPEVYELKEILEYFNGISIDSISRQSVQLEHIYLQVTQGINTVNSEQ
jgi:ABC-2 type transport system ATP-binding protein